MGAGKARQSLLAIADAPDSTGLGSGKHGRPKRHTHEQMKSDIMGICATLTRSTYIRVLYMLTIQAPAVVLIEMGDGSVLHLTPEYFRYRLFVRCNGQPRRTDDLSLARWVDLQGKKGPPVRHGRHLPTRLWLQVLLGYFYNVLSYTVQSGYC